MAPPGERATLGGTPRNSNTRQERADVPDGNRNLATGNPKLAPETGDGKLVTGDCHMRFAILGSGAVGGYYGAGWRMPATT